MKPTYQDEVVSVPPDQSDNQARPASFNDIDSDIVETASALDEGDTSADSDEGHPRSVPTKIIDARKLANRPIVSPRLISRARRSNRRRLGVVADLDQDHDGDIDQYSERDDDDDRSCNTNASDNHNNDEINNNCFRHKSTSDSSRGERISVDNLLKSNVSSIDALNPDSHPVSHNFSNRWQRDKFVHPTKKMGRHQYIRMRRFPSGANQQQEKTVTTSTHIDRDDKMSWRKGSFSGLYRHSNAEKVLTTSRQDGIANVIVRSLNAITGGISYYLSPVLGEQLTRTPYDRVSGLDEVSSESCEFDQDKSNMPSKIRFSRLLLLLIIIGLCFALLWLTHSDIFDHIPPLPDDYEYLGLVKSESLLGVYEQYSVTTDAKPCARVGKSILAKGGSAVDAAIATLLCMGVVLPNSLGIGGGCLMTIYHKKTNKTTIIDGREVAPSYANERMYGNDSLASSRGPLSIGVPGELAAYQEAWSRFGKLPWADLFDDTIKMAEVGEPMVEHLSFALRSASHAKYISPPLSQLFRNKNTGDYLREGEILHQPALAETLKRIRDFGAKDFYEGLTGQLFIKDLKEQGGNMTMNDLKNYKAVVREPLVVKLADDLVLNTLPPPGSGIVLSVVLRIMKELGYYKWKRPQESFLATSLYNHRLIEAYKFAYAKRAGLEDMPDDNVRMEKLMNELLSDEFIRKAVKSIDEVTHNDDRYGGKEYFAEDHGTAHVSVLDAEGNAAAVTTSVNLYFGSGLYSPKTGIIYNDVMDDFVSPGMSNRFGLAPSKYNRIQPRRRPISSMAPSVLTDPATGNVKLVIGGSGGAKITTAIASVCIRNLFFGEDIKTAVDSPRIHHQFLPNHIWYEFNFPKSVLKSLEERSHIVKPILDRSSVIMAIAQIMSTNSSRIITANSDYRKGGSVDGL